MSTICNNNSPPLYLDNAQIDNVKFAKFLGIIIDENLNWSTHISYIKNTISKGLGIIHRARNFFAKKFYFTYIMLLFFQTSFTVLRYGEMLLTTVLHIANYTSQKEN